MNIKQMTRREILRNWTIYALGFFLVLLGSGVSVLPPLLTKVVIDQIIPSRSTKQLLTCGFEYLTIYVLLLTMNYVRELCFVLLSNRMSSNLQGRIVESFLGSTGGKDTRVGHGDFVSRLTTDLNTIVAFETSALIDLLSQGITLLFALTVMLSLDPRLTLIIAGPIPLLLLNSKTMVNAHRRSYLNSRKKESALADRLQETSTNRAGIWLSGANIYQLARISVAQVERRKAIVNLFHVSSIRETISSVLSFLPPFLLLFLGAIWVMDGSLSLGSIVASMSFVGRIYSPVRNFTDFSSRVNEVRVAYNRIAEITKWEAKRLIEEPGNLEQTSVPSVSLREVDLEYRQTEQVTRVFDGLTLEFNGIGLYRVTGRNGVGKTSLVGLVCGLLIPDRGIIRVGGRETTTFEQLDFLRNVSVSPQIEYIFEDSIRNNILLGTHERTCRLEMLFEELGGNDAFGPRGLDQPVSIHTLSGGQKQLVSILRCAIRDTPILLLDEPFAGLDLVTRRKVGHWISQESLTRLVLVIEHDSESFQRFITCPSTEVRIES